jgi:hypothetical protein
MIRLQAKRRRYPWRRLLNIINLCALCVSAVILFTAETQRTQSVIMRNKL